MFLHNNHELFSEIVYSTANELKLPVPIVEKDYYVTMILKLLALKEPNCVFRGGTSLSKCHHIIDRFSEDIDIAFSNHLTQGQRKKLKNETIAKISNILGLSIADWDKTHSRRDYNCYTFAYEPLDDFIPHSLIQGVKMEIVLSSIPFPTVTMDVDSYVYEFLAKENMDIIKEYDLEPFSMTLQSLDKTLADKVFAICDYYLLAKTQRHSRHIYDIYMLLPKVPQDDKFKELVRQVRSQRSGMSMCPSAISNVSISELLHEIISKGVYQKDYISITTYFQNEPVAYETAIEALREIASSNIFDDDF